MAIYNAIMAFTNWMWIFPILALLIGGGLVITVACDFVQIKHFGYMLKATFGDAAHSKSEEGISSWSAMVATLANTIGTGNIISVGSAIALGGPGAVFWMWVMAVIGSSSAFIESTLAQIYKVEENGQFRGGPSYYMEKALKKRWLGILFSIALIICFAYGFNGLQSFNMSSALEYYIPNYSQTHVPMIVGIILAVAFAAVIWGGAHRIGVITSFIVPVMAVVYILIGIYTMLTNLSSIPHVFGMIFENAFSARSFAGGFAGSAVMIGIKRGLFSNEAGMGSAPNAAASADVDHPVKQGLVQVISVFIDTLLICSTTAMMLLISGVQGESGVLDGIPFVQEAIRTNIGQWGIHFITVSIFAFAFSSLVGNYYYAESNILFIKNSKALLNIFRLTCVVAIFLGAQADFSVVWNIADITMGVMAIINIIAIMLLRKTAIKALKSYEEQKKAGKNPVFKESDIGIKDTVWK